jgi:hypothetical protein
MGMVPRSNLENATYKSKFSTDHGFFGRFFLMLSKLSLRLIGIREEPGMIDKFPIPRGIRSSENERDTM